jgi:hypothetical protein
MATFTCPLHFFQRVVKAIIYRCGDKRILTDSKSGFLTVSLCLPGTMTFRCDSHIDVDGLADCTSM